MALSSKSKLVFIGCLIAVFVFALACQDAQPPKEAESCEKPAAGNNPNGSSELSLLMRQMQRSADSMKQIILAGKTPDVFPESFRDIDVAKPTDAETKKPSFKAFSAEYIKRLEQLCKSAQQEASNNYNAVIDACLSCHGDHCPGPVKAINKLKL